MAMRVMLIVLMFLTGYFPNLARSAILQLAEQWIGVSSGVNPCIGQRTR